MGSAVALSDRVVFRKLTSESSLSASSSASSGARSTWMWCTVDIVLIVDESVSPTRIGKQWYR